LTLGPRYANIRHIKDKIMTKVFDATKFRKSITKSIQGLGVGFSDPTDWISTGNYALNYLKEFHWAR
jgi:hypothetical protein